MKRILPLLLSLCYVAACSTRVEFTRGQTQPITDSAININTATVTELERLPYIGRTTAGSVVAFRQDHGPFRRPEQLLLIRGVSETRFAEIRHLLTTR